MSAAAAAYAPASRQGTPCRPRLVSVPTGPAVDGPAGVRRRLRPTPLGRLVVLVVVAGLVTGLAFTAIGGGGGPARTITVEPGQTLSQIAATRLPAVPVDDAVARIRLANNLPSAQVQAGQRLVIPGG